MTPGKIIFKCKTGSHLYGTSRPDSDQDFCGVILHTEEQLLGLQKPPGEYTENVKTSSGSRNEKDDIDCKYFYLPKFLDLAAQGQPGQLEMLFAPDNMIIVSTPEWEQIKSNIDLFHAKKSIAPFVGFALAQANRAVIKGENLNLVREVLQELKLFINTPEGHDPVDNLITDVVGDKYQLVKKVMVNKTVSQNGKTEVIEIAGRKFDLGISIKRFYTILSGMEQQYGSRSQTAAENKYDFKSLGHAVRLLSEAEEYLLTGKITLPRPDAEFIKSILTGKIDIEIDWLDFITKKIDHIRQIVEPQSKHPEIADWSKINKLCIKIQREELKKE